ncbi:MAG: hypothetical protein FWG25_01140 [Promicromonosporaceae bacterium]|nr:hypothetical protein [Promicromonosporaceae bacterium]
MGQREDRANPNSVARLSESTGISYRRADYLAAAITGARDVGQGRPRILTDEQAELFRGAARIMSAIELRIDDALRLARGESINGITVVFDEAVA